MIVAFLVATDSNHAAAHAWVDEQLVANRPLTAPSILIAEVAGSVSRATTQVRGQRAISWLSAPGAFRLEPVTTGLAEAAAVTAVALGLKGCDSIYVELAIRTGQALVTFDREQLIRGGRVAQTYQPLAPPT